MTGTLTFWGRCDECTALLPTDKLVRLTAQDGTFVQLCDRCDPVTEEELEQAGQLGMNLFPQGAA